MKKTLSLALLCTIMFVVFSCKRTAGPTSQNAIEEIASPERINAAKLYFAKDIQGFETDIESFSIHGGRIISPDWKTARIKKLTNGATALVLDIPSFKVDNEDYALRRNVVFLLKGDEVMYGRIVEVVGTKEAMAKYKFDLISQFNDLRIPSFEGNIISYDLKYRFLRGRGYKNGIYDGNVSALTTKPKLSDLSRKASFKGAPRLATSVTSFESNCSDFYLVTYYPDGSENWQFLYTSCSPSNSTPANVVQVGGGTPITPGTATPAEFGAPPNPIDGQVWHYVYPSGTSIDFTYNKERDAWLLPDIQALVDGAIEMIDPPRVGPKFGGKFLTTLALVAVVEPSFVGEVIWGAAATVYLGIYIYDRITFLRQTQGREGDLDFCVNAYVGCTEQTPSAACDACLSFCRVQGYWDSARCPGVRPVLR
ncbi:hypothetical protein EZ456_07490 [Pedobacter psychrodurus]|uniref:Uncharacterized protein n=1 Tax=Pedobacter psychrodurus TaxID=2530456 RepID=A0A4R0PXU7_9SPHI|nr:hypothetical protein [Pedobacter psychrodurus]TCD27782.1 hypothetical protein EZ456_07490 [Pedobacter psychrodurus]